jgi:hypothetical protein
LGNTLKRQNLNIGTNTTQSFAVMALPALTDKQSPGRLALCKTDNSAENLLGQGIQDFSTALKYKLLKSQVLSFMEPWEDQPVAIMSPIFTHVYWFAFRHGIRPVDLQLPA